MRKWKFIRRQYIIGAFFAVVFKLPRHAEKQRHVNVIDTQPRVSN